MRLYFLAPLLALALFAGWHVHASAGLQRQATAEAAAQQAAQSARLAADRASQEQALAAAKLDQDRRQKERDTQAARDQEAQATRLAALAALATTRQLQADKARQIEQLQEEIAAREKNVAALEKDAQDARDDQAFYTRLAAQEEAHRKALQEVLDKLDPAAPAPAARNP
jgi:hypothetical protein